MTSRIHQKLGTAGFVIAIVALVAALCGGAYAAKNGLTHKQKKEVQKIAKKEAKKYAKRGKAGKNGAPGAQGAPGSAGPVGPAGPAGAKGDKGDTGAAGPTGATGQTGARGADGDRGPAGPAGESPTVVALSPQNAGCKDAANDDLGGVKLIGVEGEEAYACNGQGGGGGSETLAPGKTESGYWEVIGTSGITFTLGSEPWAVSTITYPTPLSAPPAETVLISFTSSPEDREKCEGTADSPKADPGVLCIYETLGEATLEFASPSTYGAALFFAETDKSFGTWAFTAPAAS